MPKTKQKKSKPASSTKRYSRDSLKSPSKKSNSPLTNTSKSQSKVPIEIKNSKTKFEIHNGGGERDALKNSFELLRKQGIVALEEILQQSLAHYVLLQSDVPIKFLMSKLCDVEIKAARIIEEHIKVSSNGALPIPVDLSRALQSVFCFIRTSPKANPKYLE